MTDGSFYERASLGFAVLIFVAIVFMFFAYAIPQIQAQRECEARGGVYLQGHICAQVQILPDTGRP